MASYVLDEFLGAGVLKDMGRKFADDGWDDVPTLKVIAAEDMEALNLTAAQRDALELRIYLHDRSLMKYADGMEASRIGLVRLVTMKPSDLASKFKMRKSHVAAFVDTSMAFAIQMPPDLLSMRSRFSSRFTERAKTVKYLKLPKPKPHLKPPPFELHKSTLSGDLSGNSPPRKSNVGDKLGFRNFYTRNSGELGFRIGHAKKSPPRKSSAGELGSRNGCPRIHSPPRKSSAGELGFNFWNSPPRRSNAGESGSRNGHARINSPPRRSNAGELGPSRNGGHAARINSPPRRSNAGELGPSRNGGHAARINSPPRRSNAGELGSSRNGHAARIYSPPRRSNAGELGSRNGGHARVNSPPRKSNAGELGSRNGGHARANSPARKSNAGELGSRNGGHARANSPARKSSAGESGFIGWSSPPRKSNVGEMGIFRNGYVARNSPPRRSSAGELGFRNGYGARNSPPRRSSAGELGFRNGYVRINSPPRKSSAGESGFSGWSSPPRKSNVGELGFNGNPCASARVGDFVFNGNSCARNSPPRRLNAGQWRYEKLSSVRPSDATKRDIGAPKGMFAATPTKRLLCGMVKAPSSDKMAKISALEKVSLRWLAPEHSYGVSPGALKGSKKPPPFTASSLWADKPTLFFCVRRPGCVMCRAEAHQLFARKPIFDALGIQLVAVLLEDIDEEVWAFWPRYWAGMVVLDEKRDFFRALGGGKLMKDSLFTGFFLNPIARLNWKRATKTGIKYNTRGEGTIKGGTFIVRPGKGGVAYQFAEKNFGDWAPLDEVLQVCHVIQEEGDSDGL